jgi:hypothetical protein
MSVKDVPHAAAPPFRRIFTHALLALAYGVGAGLAAALLALLIVVLSGPRFESGEAWQGVVIGLLVFGLPTAGIGAALSGVAVYPVYRRCRSAASAAAVFVLTLCLLTAAILVVSGWVVSYAVDAS